jgi:predicted DNA binding CopG/RHH family protein
MRKEYDFSKLRRAQPKYIKRLKASVTMRIDPLVIHYFKEIASKKGIPYQSLINFVLKEYAASKLEPSANWEN